jgi:putative ABC transport system permease protein
VEGWLFARTELVLDDGSAGDNVALLAPPAGSKLIKPIMLKGRWVEPGDQNAIALSELFIDYYPELKVGDPLSLRVNGEETDWVVVGFFQLAGKVSGLSAYTNYEYLAPLINQNGRAATFRVSSIPGEPDARGNRPPPSLEAQKALGSAIEAHLKQYGIRVADIDTGLSLTKTASDGFNVLTGFLLFLALLTALVGSIGLAGTMSLNVMERTREIGILRAVGASNRKLMRIVLLEGITMGLLSWALGSLAAFPISKILSDSISLALFGGTSSFGLSITGFVVWLAAVMLLSVLASVLPARSATRLTIREVLSYE